MGIAIGAISIGMSSGEEPQATLPPSYIIDERTVNEHIAYLLDKIEEMTVVIEGKADSDRLRTLVAYSDEAIRIQAEDIVLVGDVTLAAVRANQAGLANDLDISITRITGDVIRTGLIQGNAWSATQGIQIDLNNDKIQAGGSDAPSLLFEAGDLTISGTLTAASIILGDTTGEFITAGGLFAQNEAAYNLQQALEVSGTTILAGVLVPTNTGAMKTGTITWNSTTGALTGGTGIAITEWGIIGAASGSATFTIQASNGAATFAGSLSAADGTFVGDITTSGRIRASGVYTGYGYNASIIGEPSSSNSVGVFGYNDTSGYGILGITNAASGIGVEGRANSSSAFAALVGTGIGNTVPALYLTGYIDKARVNGQTISVYDTTTHALVDTYEYSFEV